MVKYLAVCVAIISVVFITGCQSSYVNQPSSPLDVEAKAKVCPKIAIGEKIQASATIHNVLFFFSWGPGQFAEGVNYGSNLPADSLSSSVGEAKAAAAYKACIANKADFIICPRYYVTTTNYFFYKKTEAKVFGYKGILEGIDKFEHKNKQKIVDNNVQFINPIELKPIQIAQPIKIELPNTKKQQTPTKIATPNSSKSVMSKSMPDASTK